MKKVVFIIFIVQSIIFSHQQHVHQYFVREAYELLKLYVGYDIPTLRQWIKFEEGFYGPGPWQTGYIDVGAWREDNEDVVFHFSENNRPSITGVGGVILGTPFVNQLILAFTEDPFISSTHFWHPDNGDETPSDLEGVMAGIYFKFTVPNAYQKFIKYVNGGWELNVNLILYGFPTRSDGTGGCATQRALVTFRYNTLKDLYINKNIYVTKVTWLSGQQTIYNLPVKFRSYHWSSLNSGSYNLFFSKLTFEILGRMCHLLGDMSVPAHTRNDIHGSDASGIRQDTYEKYFGYDFYWNANLVYNNFGGPFIPSSNPLHFLFYTTAQIANYFGSNGPYNGDGNNFIGGNYNYEEFNYLHNQFNGFLTHIDGYDIRSMRGNDNEYTPNIIEYIRDKTFPHTIRATAGLLYWFAKETNILPPPPLSATISGPSTAPCATGTWNANASGGYPPYSYQWYHMYTSSGGLESSLQKETGIIQPNRLIDTWYPVGNNTSTLNYYLCGGNSYLQVDVRDSHNTLKTVQYYVAGSNGGGGGLEKEVAGNNSNDYRLESENPKEYSLKQNYPNPFNPSTIISYTIKKEGRVSIKIYDTLGKEVAALVDEIKPAGNYEVEFNGKELPSGVYIYKMQCAECLSTSKMLLIK